MAGKIFISYRRDDERAPAARIRDRLAASFGERHVFMDVDNLLAGQRFDKELETALAQCDVFIAVIGNQRANLLTERQAANERDFVVDEIAAAIARGIPVIPVLVDGAPLPQAEALPASIATLPLHQTHEVKHESFGRDVEALIAAIRAVRSLRRTGARQRVPWGNLAAALALLVVVGAGVWGAPFAFDWWEERQEEARRVEAETARQAALDEKQRQEAERKRAEERARHRAEGRIKVLVGLSGREQTRWLKPGAGKTEWFKDCATCPEMVVVPAGSFRMGSNNGDKDEKPVRTVTIAKPFAVGRFEVTFAEWDACVAAGGCKHKPDDKGWGRGRRPVIDESWKDARQYVGWLSKTMGKRYRLLSEAEWEYAARARTTTKYAFGDTISTWQAQFAAGKTVKVGSFKPNVFGLYDMHGNVWEWVEDCWHKSYAGAPSDGSSWSTGDCKYPVLRGGGWNYNARYLRSAYRYWGRAGNWDVDVGFRVARAL
jgi:formylglycine-generating enzyme required for sulfatase activity